MVKAFIQELPNDSRAIESSKILFEDETTAQNLALIKANFKVLKEAIVELEERQPLINAINIIKKVKNSLTLEPFSKKLDDILKKNPGYEKMEKFGAVLSGENVEGLSEDPGTIFNFRCAPMTSVDCERAFSRFKDIFLSKRRCLTEGHLKDLMLIQWNSEMLE